MLNAIFKNFTAAVLVILGLYVHADAQACSPAPVGLVSWWSGDNNALDLRARNNGTLENGAVFTGGQIGQAFDLDTASARAFAPGNGSLNILGPQVTIEGWVRLEPNDVFPSQRFTGRIGKLTFPTENYAILFENSGTGGSANLPANQWQFEYILTNSSGFRSHNQFTSVIVPADGNYHHIALTYNGAEQIEQNVRLYVDGLFAGPSGIPLAQQISGNLLSSPAEPFQIVPGGTPFAADEISVYSRVLSAQEIAAIHAAGNAGKCKPTATEAPSGLVGWWSGDGDANDVSGNANNGTTQNGAGFAVGGIGQSFSFDGSNDYVSVPDAADGSLDISGRLTIEAWINPSVIVGGQRQILSKRNNAGSAVNLSLFLQSDGRLAWSEFDGSNFIVYEATASVPANAYSHVAVRITDSTISFFIDGAQAGSFPYTSARVANDGPVTIGAAFINSTAVAPFAGVIDEVSLYNEAIDDAAIQSILNAGIAGKLKEIPTPSGANVVVNAKSDATITFPSVSVAGTTHQIPIRPDLLPPLPLGTHTGLVYDIATSAVFTGSPAACFKLPSFANEGIFASLRVLHLEAGVWVDRTTTSDFATRTLCAQMGSLSPFAIAQLAPNAAPAAISGRVTDSFGRGIRGVTVMAFGPAGTLRSAITNSFGRYKLSDLRAGETYIVQALSRRYQFDDPTRVISLDADVTEEDFVAAGRRFEIGSGLFRSQCRSDGKRLCLSATGLRVPFGP